MNASLTGFHYTSERPLHSKAQRSTTTRRPIRVRVRVRDSLVSSLLVVCHVRRVAEREGTRLPAAAVHGFLALEQAARREVADLEHVHHLRIRSDRMHP